MKKSAFATFTKSVASVLKRRSPEILTGVGIAGLLTTTVLAVKGTPKALLLIEEKKEEKDTEKLTVTETVKAAWKCYIPAATTGVISVACIIGARSVSCRRNTALAAAYSLSETALREYTEKVVETIGEKKEHAVRDAMAKEKIEKNPMSKQEVVITEKGNTLCYDYLSGRFFKNDIDKLKRAVNNLNKQMINELYVSLNDFYREIGIGGIGIGEDVGWNINRGLIELYFSAQLNEEQEPCVVLEFECQPFYEFQRI
ncbi:MAG: DUF6353 family protein [Clostridia bacterium]